MRQRARELTGIDNGRGTICQPVVDHLDLSHEMRGRHDSEVAALLHRDPHVTRAQHHLRAMLHELLADAAAAGTVRDDTAPDELAGYCLHALSAASALTSREAVHRLITVTMDGLRPSADPGR